ncbi:MAG TPA: DUF3105 domain-containing protein [Nitrospiria bacterium]
MKKFRKGFVLLVYSLFFSAIPVLSEAGKVPVGFVANAGNNNVQIIDLNSGKTLTKLYTGASPWRLLFSPDQRELWVQHWYSENTVAVDLPSLIVSGQIPARGPGIFNEKGNLFWSYSWPGSILQAYYVKSFKAKDRIQTEVKLPYELALAWGEKNLYVGQYDPISKGDKRVYSYVLSYPMGKENPAGTSIPTGDSSIRMQMDPTGEFLVVANVDGSEITLINEHNARAKITLVPGPRDVIFAGEENLIAICWKKGERVSEILTMKVDWGKRPWPEFKPALARKFRGGLVTAKLAPSGKELFALDQLGENLVVFNLETLEEIRAIPVGDVPYDFVMTEVEERERDRWGKKRENQIRLERIIRGIKKNGASFQELSFVEKFKPVEEKPNPLEIEKKEKEKEIDPKKIRTFFRVPDNFRQEFQNGGARLAEKGWGIAIPPGGQFYSLPRQDLSYLLYAINSLSVEEVIRHMAGDVSGSPFLKNGIAVDILGNVKEGDHKYHVIGAKKTGEQVSQIWIDAEKMIPVSLIEKFPIMANPSPHEGSQIPKGIAETKLLYEKVQEKYFLPVRMMRLMDGRVIGKVYLEDIRINPGLKDFHFDLSQLGGLGIKPEKKMLAKTVSLQKEPGRTVPGLGNEHIDHPIVPHEPYNSNPPTSGPHTRYIAEWGVHEIPIPLEEQVHNLEDGGVLIQYNCPDGCDPWKKQMGELARKYDRLVVAPYPLMDSKLALTAWEKIQIFNDYDENKIIEFIDAYINIDHHPSKPENKNQ